MEELRARLQGLSYDQLLSFAEFLEEGSREEELLFEALYGAELEYYGELSGDARDSWQEEYEV